MLGGQDELGIQRSKNENLYKLKHKSRFQKLSPCYFLFTNVAVALSLSLTVVLDSFGRGS